MCSIFWKSSLKKIIPNKAITVRFDKKDNKEKREKKRERAREEHFNKFIVGFSKTDPLGFRYVEKSYKSILSIGNEKLIGKIKNFIKDNTPRLSRKNRKNRKKNKTRKKI